jgi:transporter, CPA2 family (2.A.37)
VDGFDRKSLEQIQCQTATAIVTLLTDRENLDICETAFEHFATQTLVARLNDRSNFSAFQDLNVLVVDPSTAIIGLLDHFVRAPEAASLLMGFQRGRDVADVTVRNPDLDGISLRDLRLPFDSVIIAIRRRERSLSLFEMLSQRENEMTTVLAPGLAIPHIIIEGENQFGMLIVRSKKGIIFRPNPKRSCRICTGGHKG